MNKHSIANAPRQKIGQQEERTLTRRMNSILHDLDKEFEVYDKYDFQKQIQIVRSASPQAQPTEMQRLLEMLKPLHFTKKAPTLAACAKFVDDYFRVNLYQNSTVELMLKKMCEKYVSAPTPVDYLKRIVDDLGDPAWKRNTLRVRILKQAIRYGNFLVEPYGDTSKKLIEKKLGTKDVDVILKKIGEEFFKEVYDTQSKEMQKKLALFRFADELAGAKFRTDGQIEKLYIFAVIFNMTYLLSDGSRDVKRDIELRLFYQYYTDNAMRPRGSAYSKYISERGVNLKNYYEVMYLYYICQEDMEPDEKLRRITENLTALEKKIKAERKQKKDQEAADLDAKVEELLVRVPDATEEQRKELRAALSASMMYEQDVPSETEEPNTQLYIHEFETVVRLTEHELLEHLMQKYRCDRSNMTATSIASEQKTAFCEFQKLIAEIKEYDGDYHQIEVLDALNVQKAIKDGLMSSDAEEQGQKLSEKEWKEKYPIYQEAHKIAETRIGYIYSPSLADMISAVEKLKEKDASDSWDKFLSMLKEMNHLVTMEESQVTETNICRTLMIVFLLQRFYYEYEEMNDFGYEDEMYDLYSDYRFTKFFADFQAFARPYLLKARYQEISGKHLTDVILTFSLYVSVKNFF